MNTFPLLGSRYLIMQQLVYDNWNRLISMWSMPKCYKQGTMLMISSRVLYGRLWRLNLSAWSWRISTVRNRCQGWAREDTAGWKRLCGCCCDLCILEISGGAVTRRLGAMSSVVSSISQRATAWAQKLKNLHCWELLPGNNKGRL
jgi:hypothetical protein